ncbi:MAG: hypothetical protein QOF36_2624 [Microbacteriaceae bacterium]|jgi:hypothetical protein|nr:hypothetical protein [Microbacteriaceae bacterium]
MADDDAADILAGKMFCPQCGTQLDPDDDDPNVGSCPGCGFHGDPNASAPDVDDDEDEDDLDPAGAHFPDAPDTGRTDWQSGPSYADYVRQARGKSVDDLFADAAARVKPPKPLKTEDDLEEALGTASAAALSTAGVCPSCGAEPDKIIDGTCSECGATQAAGIEAWVVADDYGKTYGACSELCGKVGAAQKDGKLLGKRPWTPPEDDDEPKCFVCAEPLTVVAPSAAPAPTVAPGAGPGGTTVVSGMPVVANPFKDGDRVQLPNGDLGTVSGVSPWSLGANDHSTGVDLDKGGHATCSVDMLTRIEEDA